MSAERGSEIWIFLFILIVGAAVPLLAAFVFPHWRGNWGRGGKVPMSQRGKVAMGTYVAYFGSSVLAASFVGTKTAQIVCLVGILLAMIAMYPVYLRDRREHENSFRNK
jgi:hypothetical protein